ncbi:hypothetical protein KC19_VG331400 [Ceratodon purpureus]|uniref:Uncharacterized protein n=1 Tax=Ceratodon purpureus TaxID=3225 RepID=A0A8T0HVW8_CERPU|nr:hypothetical protein KC19_VG331400 [Ceratodon purpureus]
MHALVGLGFFAPPSQARSSRLLLLANPGSVVLLKIGNRSADRNELAFGMEVCCKFYPALSSF